MSALEITIPDTDSLDESEGYSPKKNPVIMTMAEKLYRSKKEEIMVEKISEFCTIVDRSETKIVGIGLTVTYESRGYGYGGYEFASCDLNDYFFAKKVIPEGEIALLAEIIGINLANTEIVSSRYDVVGDGNYKVIVGIEVESFDNLPEYLPENTITLTIPPCRYAKVLINEKKKENRIGYDERMQADEYFIGEFRKDTKYVYNNFGYPMNTYDETGDMVTKYEPVKIPADDTELYDSFRFKLVTLPKMKIACSITEPDSKDFVIYKYFGVEKQVFCTDAAKYYLHDYYGFPVNSEIEGKINSCFGTRVSTFEGIPDCVEQITLPGGIYLHITQLEFNGDNPAMPYDVAFNHIDELFLSSHPHYKRDWNRHVIARFRQANCASVFVPLLYQHR